MKQIKHILLISIISLLFVGCDIEDTLNSISNELDNVVENIESVNESTDQDEKENDDNTIDENNTDEMLDSDADDDTALVVNKDIITFEGYTLIEVDGGDLSGHREPNVVVDIGYGDREYYSFTNDYGQLERVIAAQIRLQNEDSEPVTSSGRYYSDEAKVPGTESPVLDEGHVIADSLGAVANAYNITPQNSTLNRHGEQAYLENSIRSALYDGGTCTNFEAIITYPNTETQIPSHYSFTYTLNGTVINDEFDNLDPDEANEQLEEVVVDEVKEEIGMTSDISIMQLDKIQEFIILKNNGDSPINITGWTIVSVRGDQRYTFGTYTLEAQATVAVGDSDKGSVDIHWLEGRGVWNNSDSDPAELYDSSNNLIDRLDD